MEKDAQNLESCVESARTKWSLHYWTFKFLQFRNIWNFDGYLHRTNSNNFDNKSLWLGFHFLYFGGSEIINVLWQEWAAWYFFETCAATLFCYLEKMLLFKIQILNQFNGKLTTKTANRKMLKFQKIINNIFCNFFKIKTFVGFENKWSNQQANPKETKWRISKLNKNQINIKCKLIILSKKCLNFSKMFWSSLNTHVNGFLFFLNEKSTKNNMIL